MDKEITAEERLRLEEMVNERTDDNGVRWHKVYFGGGTHFEGWLEQCKELYGDDNIEVEEIEATGFICFEESGEKLYRIWAKKNDGDDLPSV